MCVCVSVCVRARVCVRECVCVRVRTRAGISSGIKLCFHAELLTHHVRLQRRYNVRGTRSINKAHF